MHPPSSLLAVRRRKCCPKLQMAAAGALALCGAIIWMLCGRTALALEPLLARPTAAQLRWQELEIGALIHFNMATYAPSVITLAAKMLRPPRDTVLKRYRVPHPLSGDSDGYATPKPPNPRQSTA